ncbi:uncharacterized protein LOC119832287 [Zerene cesonia]|uniref:uncharacterized protein LOC119832287 n=1 Tax=Zerene cesonia TaxID=33412 RepID=UPI0018E57194|nr:uncharacterized protein LOC119832287 [Zerene cesonia]
MNNIKMLSGDEIVTKGVTRLEANLPELGLKDVVPNGSWLEQKQIQASLEAKKCLIEVERIEKRGSLSHAEWREDLMLAEVTQKCGGYWQYLGHNVGRILYLKPEEALLLMELNCLLLKYGGVSVSLQQAYTLLLQGDITLLKYKVYASLSRIGYKVYRHRARVNNKLKLEQKNEKPDENTNIHLTVLSAANNINTNNEEKTTEEIPKQECDTSCNSNGTKEIKVPGESGNENMKPEKIHATETINVQKYNSVYKSYQNKLSRLKNRKLKQCCAEKTNDIFSSIPDLLEKRTVTLKVPEAKYVPNDMVLEESYTINLRNVPKKCTKSSSLSYSSGDEASGSHVKRLRTASTSGPSNSNRPHSTQIYQNNQFRQFSYPRPQSNFSFFNINMLFQRPFVQQIFFPTPFQSRGSQFFQRPQFYQRSQMFQRLPFNNYNYFNSRGNSPVVPNNVSNQEAYLERIKTLAQRLKQLVARGNVNQDNTQSLQKLLNTYNLRYKTNLRLGPYFEIISAEAIETIDLDLDDEEPQNKKRKTDDDSLEDNLKSIEKVALELKSLEMSGKATPRHRRTFSKLLKTFNRCYNTDYYLNSMHDIINRRHIILDSSSDTDCVIQEEITKAPMHKSKKSKKLRNPFNILKRLSEKQDIANEANISTHDECLEMKDKKYNDAIREAITGKWLPSESDFGRVELCNEYGIDPMLTKTKLLYDFVKFKPNAFENWLGLKIAFLESLKESITEFQDISIFETHFDVDCLVKPEDCSDTQSVLQKLRIIKSNKEINSNSTLNIDFDVYNRNVESFKKTDPPIPHFRVICLEESSILPTATEIEALHSQYTDNVPIVFALVSMSSISYLQVRPMEIPVYAPSENF